MVNPHVYTVGGKAATAVGGRPSLDFHVQTYGIVFVLITSAVCTHGELSNLISSLPVVVAVDVESTRTDLKELNIN